ncbi:hypothetical protein ACFW5I_00320 [Streptomyces sp. NPDC058818]|uniref:hypothetical protein n=1 Tax=Streptomyces sp. NPDC058818 TaxID=3346640 RepID=UPI0036AD752D
MYARRTDEPAHRRATFPRAAVPALRTPEAAALELQSRAGNAAFARTVQRQPNDTEQGPRRNTPMSDLSLVDSAEELARRKPAQFLELVFNGLRVDEFRFGPGEQGNLGLNMISQWVTVPLEGGGKLAVHLNCMVKATQLQRGTIGLEVAQFHLTARSVDTQKNIDKNGPSAGTAAHSIHINTSTPRWGREANLKSLAGDVAAAGGESVLIEGLTRREGYSHAYVKWLVGHFKESVHHAIQLRLGALNVTWKGDATFGV